MYFVKVLLLISTCLMAISSEPQYEYFFIGQTVNYDTAKSLCDSHEEDKSWDMAMPKTEEEVNAVKKYLNKVAADKRVWIGLTDREKEGEFRWEDGTKLEKLLFGWNGNLNPNDDGNEDCVEIVGDAGWKMNDAKCGATHVHGVVCQKEERLQQKEAPAKRVMTRTTTEKPSNTSTIVVIIVATLFLLGLAVGCMVYYMKTSKKQRHGGDSSEGDAEDGASVYSYAASASRASTSSMAAGSSRASSSSFGNSRKSSPVGGSSRASRASLGNRKSAVSIGSHGRTSFASRKHSAV